jgi:CRISPR-associated protein Csm4
MQTLCFTLRPCTAFGTPLAGDTLFGHLCWALRLRHGEQALAGWLEGYTAGRPFAVVSDGVPAGLLPRPTAPRSALGTVAATAEARKADRRRRWLPRPSVPRPLDEWLADAVEGPRQSLEVRTVNTIHRLTGTTGTGPFAPRRDELLPLGAAGNWEVFVVLDESRLSAAALQEVMGDVGTVGYGRDASTGLGKFETVACSVVEWPQMAAPMALALAPLALDAASLDAAGTWWLPLTRFGRHGGWAATSAAPFRKPVLLARTGALLAWSSPSRARFHGRGLGGADAPLSFVLPATVQQAYAPVWPVLAPTRTAAARSTGREAA